MDSTTLRKLNRVETELLQHHVVPAQTALFIRAVDETINKILRPGHPTIADTLYKALWQHLGGEMSRIVPEDEWTWRLRKFEEVVLRELSDLALLKRYHDGLMTAFITHGILPADDAHRRFGR